ncbi:MAG: DEAD/DEAH box helicase family protein [Bacteroidia bacterium]|jgi:replicative superfamily II helicase|nr:DEAD/DEAH box helicase family protein [Bacteroidia bacterium]
MVDFGKRVATKATAIKTNPVDIYETLDRASDKNALRPAQLSVLTDWWDSYQEKKNVILKLHTGQGKTLIGLLILQSKLNQQKGPALYLSPTQNLVNQTCEQAKQFGFKYCTINEDKTIPNDFLESKSILITSVQKLFNGLTKFGINNQSEMVGCIVLDDSHACIDAIQKAFTITIKNNENGYEKLIQIFENELEKQGLGTLMDVKSKSHDAFLLVPYWAWQDKVYEVTELISGLQDSLNIKFAWRLIKDSIGECQCIVSGSHIEISPYLNPIEQFGTFSKADHRVLMSATTNDDSFFIKGLGLDKDAILNPLTYAKEKWSGEKMILIPSLIDESLDRKAIVEEYSPRTKGREYGVIALVPSFAQSEIWEDSGAKISKSDSIDDDISILKAGEFDNCNVLVNRYDGIDLADNSCRVLVLDSKPYAQNLSDRYQEYCRVDSEAILVKIAQKIEQGLGRGVRGERDYCVIILTGSELVSAIRSKKNRKFFSTQTQTQIDIGIEIAGIAKEELKPGTNKIEVVKGLIKQCIKRDDGWKLFYVDKMNSAPVVEREKRVLNVLQLEKDAEVKHLMGEHEKAADIIQKLIDDFVTDKTEIGWYMQEISRYLYPKSKTESNAKQVAAHKMNKLLLKPREGMNVSKINFVSQNRIENIIKWIKGFDNHQQLTIQLDEILNNLQFGVKSEKFESAVNELGLVLGFSAEQPDRERGQGPDNLWCIRDNDYILFECKNEVKDHRTEIVKTEVGQMNNSCAWFEREYEFNYKPMMIVPTKYVTAAAGFSNSNTEVILRAGLSKLIHNVKAFFKEFRSLDVNDLSADHMQKLLDAHSLGINDLKSNYSEKPIQK